MQTDPLIIPQMIKESKSQHILCIINCFSVIIFISSLITALRYHFYYNTFITLDSRNVYTQFSSIQIIGWLLIICALLSLLLLINTISNRLFLDMLYTNNIMHVHFLSLLFNSTLFLVTLFPEDDNDSNARVRIIAIFIALISLLLLLYCYIKTQYTKMIVLKGFLFKKINLTCLIGFDMLYMCIALFEYFNDEKQVFIYYNIALGFITSLFIVLFKDVIIGGFFLVVELSMLINSNNKENNDNAYITLDDNLRIVSIGISIVIFITSAFVYYYYRKKVLY